MDDVTQEPAFKVGDRVQRKSGASYAFPGIVISTGLKLDGKTWHCEVECIAPMVEGCTHVFPDRLLKPLDEEWFAAATEAKQDAVIAALREGVAMLEGIVTDSRKFVAQPLHARHPERAPLTARIDTALKDTTT